MAARIDDRCRDCRPDAMGPGDAGRCPIVDAAPVPLVLVDETGALCRLNTAFTRTFGHRPEDIPTWADWCRLAIPDPAERERALRLGREAPSPGEGRGEAGGGGEGGTPEPVELHVRCRDGALCSVLARVTPLDSGDRLYTLQDITAFRQARDAALSSNAAKSAFLAHMSHEIRTPLNALLVLVQSLEQEPLDDSHRRMVARIHGAGDSLVAILNDILDLSKIEAGELRIDPRPFDLGVVLAHLESLLGPAARARNLTLKVEAPTMVPCRFMGDELRLEQVLTNLLANAIKFTEQGEVSLRVEAHEAGRKAARLCFTVTDTGIGMTPATLARIFAPFAQAEPRIGRQFAGTGLGLPICKRLIEQMGGEIRVESQPGVGSRFWFELLLARAGGRALSSQRTAPAASTVRGPRLAGMRLLVVDDNALNRDALALVLTLEGATVALASDGRQALEQLRADPAGCDGVLMDVQMPVMDGLTATRLIRTELGLPDLPIIAFTGAVFDDEIETVRTAGVTAVLAKPPDLGEMIGLLASQAPAGAATVSRDTGEGVDPGLGEDTGVFPNIPGIDRARATRTLGGNRALFLDLLARFIQAAPGMVAAARSALVAGAPETAARHLHTLKDNAGLVGAIELMGEAQWLAGAVERGVTGLEDRLKALAAGIDELKAVSDNLRAAGGAAGGAVGAPPPAAVPAAEPVGYAERLAALRESLDIQSLDAFERFDELRPALLDALGEDGCQALGRAIRDLRFTEAAAQLAFTPA